MKTKIIANYLPQFHAIKENDEWWGKGYTDWCAVKKAKPQFNGHEQPKIPLNENYYSLNDVEVIRKQALLARKYGIYGFGIYHYWFSSEMCLLDEPVKILNSNDDIDINYMFIWDNASWKRTWSNVRFGNDWAPLYEDSTKERKNGILAELKYGDKIEWEKHFYYLLPFFKDARYIKVDNKPVFAFYNQNNEPNIVKKMIVFWNELAKENGFNGIYDLGKHNFENIKVTNNEFVYNPEWTAWTGHNIMERVKNKIIRQIKRKGPFLYDYDKVWNKLIKEAKGKKLGDNVYYSGFVSYDDSPRRGQNGKVICGSTPHKFEEYLSRLFEICNEQNKEFLFLTAWNEWGEGAYLEPDEKQKYLYLEAIKHVVG